MAQLRAPDGRVPARAPVLVDFWTYSCINWLRTLPYLRAWHERYRDRLVVIGVHAPEFRFEHDLDNVRRAHGELGVAYPVVIDNDFTIWRAFENHYWPAVYLVDGDGRVGFRHFGEGAYEETERAIQQQLGVDEELVSVDAGGLAQAADWDTLQSPETYLGRARGERRQDKHADALALNEWALAGDWSLGDEAAGLDAAGGSIAYRFEGRDVNLVLARLRRRRSVSRCGSTAIRPATPTGSTSTQPARVRCPSRGCTSSCGNAERSASGPSRSRSTARRARLRLHLRVATSPGSRRARRGASSGAPGSTMPRGRARARARG